MSTENSLSENKDDYALVIGIDDYPMIEGASLQNARKDAESVYKWLTKQGGVPLENAHLLQSAANGEDSTPQKQQIDRAYKQIFDSAEAKGQARRLYVYFAGHGVSQEVSHVALLTAGVSLSYMNASLDAEAYQKGLTLKALFDEQVIFYDCCRNYDWHIRGVGPDWTTADATDRSVHLKQRVLFAAGFTQSANARPVHNTKRGIFTEALLEGLNGGACRKRENGEWEISFRTLTDYLAVRVKQIAKDEGYGSQEVHESTDGEAGDLILLQSPKPELIRMTAEVSTLQGSVIVRDRYFQELSRKPLQNGKAEFEFPAGEYVVQIEPPTDLINPSQIATLGEFAAQTIVFT